ncbi:flavin reductase (DIM6/NTAB) family NADH-FMN oxidoreductase RutF [Novosphingobium sp. PhB55]|uniref:flavin reductase family protein n=1 Tax=Novosphingobium sp. PhB55 TaxID=2485106 RepID=UPI0010647789|nr:flavin reductase family protein [Novosphingobium sp. PhB55]TDW63865.1 flavin reductase (DIM6/NTAB) family NADH-FMN oxidoreductase RutF [Novosphingobium sp. PhB55]
MTHWREVPPSHARQFLEPGPVVLLATHDAGASADNVMAMGWHQVLEFTPALISCLVSRGNHSHALLRRSGECTINVPTADLLDMVVRIGNCSGADCDKFADLGIEREPAAHVAAPLLPQCHAQLECRLHDDAMVGQYDLFILEVLRIRTATSPKAPQFVHYLGDGQFMLSGKRVSRKRLFQPEMLGI